jgi:ABC-type spermidine/putrescine transport system permease subunit I
MAAPAARVMTMPGLAALLPTSLAALLAVGNNDALDWVYGAAASIIFVAVIAIPAAVLNSRDHKRRQRERSAGQRSA